MGRLLVGCVDEDTRGVQVTLTMWIRTTIVDKDQRQRTCRGHSSSKYVHSQHCFTITDVRGGCKERKERGSVCVRDRVAGREWERESVCVRERERETERQRETEREREEEEMG